MVTTYPDLAGRTAIVTGGSRGLGAATCRAFAANGAKVAVNGRDASAIEAVVREVREIGVDAIDAMADCTDSSALEEMRIRVEEQFGPVDVLAAFAGGGRQPQPLVDISEAEWRDDLERNLTATFLTVKVFLSTMVERGSGSIITMASSAARQAGGGPMAYAAAKAGVINFTKQVANEVGPYGVRVNCLAPSTIATERIKTAIPAERRHEMTALYPLRRLGAPDDVAQAALFLASDVSAWITGITLDVAGGQIMT